MKSENAALVQRVVASVSQSSKKEQRAAKVKERGAVRVAVVFSLCVVVMAARESLLQEQCIRRMRSEVERVDNLIARCDWRRLSERAVLYGELATFLDVSEEDARVALETDEVGESADLMGFWRAPWRRRKTRRGCAGGCSKTKVNQATAMAD